MYAAFAAAAHKKIRRYIECIQLISPMAIAASLYPFFSPEVKKRQNDAASDKRNMIIINNLVQYLLFLYYLINQF